MNQERNLNKIIEALLFASDEPLTLRRLRNILTVPVETEANTAEAVVPPQEAAVLAEEAVVEPGVEIPVEEEIPAKPTKLDDEIRQAIAELRSKYCGEDSPVIVLELAEGWQMATNPSYGQWVKKLFKNRMSFRLSQAALETLSIAAYRQPITRAEIEHIRGVEVIASLETLIERNLLKVVGRKETVGRPILYGTSPEFLRQFGLRSLEDLPPLEQPAELQAPEPVLSDLPVLSAVEGSAAEPVASEPEPAANTTES